MGKPLLLLVGPLPEPRGGISVHLERLGRLAAGRFQVAYVDEARSRKPGMFNLRSLNLFRYLSLLGDADIVHVHSGRPGLRLLHVAATRLRGRRVLVTVHGCTFTTCFGLLLDRLSLRWAQRVVAVDGETAARLRLRGRVLVRNGFIPPLMDKEPALPPEVERWLGEQRRRQHAVFAANAWRLDLYRGADLYGLDLCIDLARRLRDLGKAASFVFAVSLLEGDGGRYARSGASIRAHGLQDTFLLWHGPLSFPRLIREADVVLRPTRADGDSLTVREALYLRKPVLASDVVQRPQGVALFRAEDAGDFLARAIDLMQKGSAPATAVAEDDSLDFYNHLYDGVMN